MYALDPFRCACSFFWFLSGTNEELFSVGVESVAAMRIFLLLRPIWLVVVLFRLCFLIAILMVPGALVCDSYSSRTPTRCVVP